MASYDDMYEDNLLGTKWLGEVVDNEDPDFLGKVKVKVWGKFDQIDTNIIPWALPDNLMTGGSESGAGFHSVAKKGSIVEVEFNNGDLYTPKWKSINRLSDELKDKIGNTDYYKNANVLLYDTETNIYLYHIKHEDQGFLIRTKKDEDDGSNQIWIKDNDDIQIKNANKREVTLSSDNILIKNKDQRIVHVTDNGISLGSLDESAEPGVLGEKNNKLHQDTLTQIDTILTHLVTYCKTQETAAKSLPFLLPLVSGYTVLGESLNAIKPLISKLKTKDSPATCSKIVTLD